MNNERRKELRRALEMLREVNLSGPQEIVAQAAEEEQEAFDNMTEGLQASDRGQRMEEVASALQDVADTLDTMLGELDEQISAIEDAIDG